MSDDKSPTCSVTMTGMPQELTSVREAYLELGWTEHTRVIREGRGLVEVHLIHAHLPGVTTVIKEEVDD